MSINCTIAHPLYSRFASPVCGASIAEVVAMRPLDSHPVGVIPAAEIAALRASGERTARANDSHTSESAWHTGGVLNFDQSFAPWVAAPPVLRLAEQVFGVE